MKNFYNTLSLLLFIVAMTQSGNILAQATASPAKQNSMQDMTPVPVEAKEGVVDTKSNPEAAASVVSDLAVSAAALTPSTFSAYRKNANQLAGVKVLGFCDNEKIVILQFNKNEYGKSVPADSKSSEPNELSYEDLMNHLAANLSAATKIQSFSSPKHPDEVQRNCAKFKK